MLTQIDQEGTNYRLGQLSHQLSDIQLFSNGFDGLLINLMNSNIHV